MSQSYLEQYRSAIPTKQGDQILKRLTRESESGRISTIDEFQSRLQTLTAQVLKEKIQPTLEFVGATLNEAISSEVWNEIIQRLEDDLEAAFAEANAIDEILDSHSSLLLSVVARSIYMAINRIEAQIELYEYLDDNDSGYDDALYNTFRDEDGNTARGEDTNTLFVDPRANAANAEMEPDEDAYVDLQGDRLILGRDKNEEVDVRTVSFLANVSSHHSELNVEGKRSGLNNIIDGTENTYWIYPVLLTSQDSAVDIELLFDFGKIRDVNSIVVEPASESPMQLIAVDQIYEGDQVVSVPIDDPITIQGQTKIHFDRITTQFVKVTLRQINGSVTQFRLGPSGSIQQQAATLKNNVKGTPEDVAVELREALTSQNLLQDIIGLPTEDYPIVSYYQYVFGLDNVRFYNEEYNQRSLFLAKKKRVLFPGEIGLRVTETRPTQAGGSSAVGIESFEWGASTSFHHGAVEYWVYGEFYADDDTLLQAETIPLFPIGGSRITHEQLVFVKKSASTLMFEDLSSTQFYCDADTTDVVVYKNSKALLNTAWSFETSDTDVYQGTPNNGSPMRMGIKITSRANPLDIYTISYTPRVSNTNFSTSASALAEVNDLVGNNSAVLVDGNIVRFTEIIGSSKIAYADFYLMIVLRRNSAKVSRTPAVEDYMLLTGSRDLKKFS